MNFASLFLFLLSILGMTQSGSGEQDEGEGDIPINYVSCGHSFPNNFVPGPKTNIGETPWIALLGCEDEKTDTITYACTGALINSRYILTTSQCIYTKRRLSHARLGEQNINTDLDCFRTRLHPCIIKTTPLDLEIEEAIPHPTFNKRNYLSDNIGLIRLEETVYLSHHHGLINPVCLPSANMNARIYFQNRMAQVVGWDFGSGHPSATLMREFLRPPENDIRCSLLYRGFDNTTQICMRSTTVRKRCVGDSGSPLSLPGPHGPPYLLVGILSFGPLPCAGSDSPSVYTSVSYYRNWIDKNMRPYTLL